MGIGNGIGISWGKVSMARGPVVNEAFEFTVQTDNAGTSAANQFTIPTTGAGYNYDISTSDGQTITGATGDTTITFPSAGSYTIKVTGDFPRIYFNNVGDKLKITNISNWGAGAWTSFDGAFNNCNNMTITATDIPNVSAVTRFYFAFRGTAISGPIDLSSWDLSSVNSIGYMFANCTGITSANLNSLSTNAVYSDSIFLGASNVTTVTLPVGFRPSSFRSMFSGAGSLTDIINVETWNLSSAASGSYWLQNTTVQPNISGWTIPPTFTLFNGLFAYCQFNVDISGWDVGNVQNFSELFAGNPAFNQPIGSWDVSNVTNMTQLFKSANAFNQDLSTWNTSSVTSLGNTFESTTASSFGIANWNTSNVNNFNATFRNNTSFNEDVSGWDITGCTGNFNDTFSGCHSFNQPIGNWNITSSVTRLSNLLRGAISFDQDLSSWNISGVTLFNTFAQGVTLSAANYDALLVAWESQAPVFSGAISFGNSQYTLGSAAETARTSLINTYGWTITDGGGIAAPFRFTVDTTQAGTSASDQFTIPITSATPYNISTSDGQSITGATGATTLTFPAPGTYTIEISDSCEGIRFNNGGDKLKLLDISSWGVFKNNVVSAFRGCANMTCSATDAPINPPTTMVFTFYQCSSFNGAVGNWDVSNVTDFSECFHSCAAFNQPLNSWDVSNATIFRNLFYRATVFNQPLDTWDTSNVTNMSGVFNHVYGAKGQFDQDISAWDVSSVTNFANMFNNTLFNQDISGWNVSNVTGMQNMFEGALFNKDISSWDTSSVTNMSKMFYSNNDFNQPIGSWNTSSVTNMREMLMAARGFDQDISGWDINQVTNFVNFGGYAGFSMTLSTANYDALLVAWEAQVPQNNISITFGNSQYTLGSAAEAARTSLINTYGWTITDGGGIAVPMIITVDTTLGDGLDNYTLNFTGTGYDIETSDGQTITGATTATTINFASPGTYDIEISGDVSTRSFISDLKLIDIKKWGSIDTPLDDKFAGANSLTTITAPDQPVNLSMTRLFKGALNFAGGISHWDVSNIVSFQRAFYNTSFDEDISSWDTSSANTFSGMFNYTPFNNGGQPGIGNWNVSNVADFSGCFAATPFNQSIGSWNIKTSGPVRMDYMFSRATAFNQDLNAWDVSSVTAMNHMFHYAGSFNQDLNSWNLASVTNMVNMFENASAFNGNISSWAFPNVTSFVSLLAGASSFNQDISGWDTSGITAMTSMFRNTYAFNQPIGIWDTSSVTKMNGMFFQSGFNQNINNWNVSLVDNMNYMFYNAAAFNQPLGDWDVSSVTDMSYMFRGAGSFNQDLSLWNTSGVNNMSGMFAGANAFNQDLSTWNTSNVTTMREMFLTYMANQGNTTLDSIGSWDVSNVTDMYRMFEGVNWGNPDISSWNTQNVQNFQRFMQSSGYFNRDLSGWNTSSATNMAAMFGYGNSQPGNIASWDIDQVTNFTNFMISNNGALSTSDYDAVLVNWENQLQTAYPGGAGYTPIISIHFGNSQYTLGSAAETARTSLINTYGWTITDGGGIALSFLLDTYTGAAAAYSLRDLSSSTTNVVRVRRSSDNTEQDFTSTQVTDGTLETFVGAGNDGFVTVWYDQSGNNYDISAANSLYQPQIVSSGILNQDNGIPYVYYNGLNQYGLSVSGIPSQTVNVWSTYYGISSEPRHTILNSNSSTYAGLIQQGSGTSADANMGSISYFKNNSAVTNTRNDLYTNLQTDGWSLVRMESVSVSNVIRPHAFDSFQNYWNGAARVNEFILFSNTQTNISGIETNINDYYTIY